jgi:hypothetical protein
VSRVALFSSLIFVAALPLSYYFGNSSTPMLVCAAGLMFLAYLVSAQLEARAARKTKRRTEHLIDCRLAATHKRQYQPAQNRPLRAGPLMLPAPRRAGDASL